MRRASLRLTRRAGVLAAASCIAVLLLLSGDAIAEPSMQYSIQESTRCDMAGGCRRMLNNAVRQATAFCTAEGGVKRGAAAGDFKCEQRGVYCVTTGRIECKGRLDPTRAPHGGPADPRPSPALPRAGPTTGRECLDEACDAYLGYPSGYRTLGLLACESGYLMAGLGGGRGGILCRRHSFVVGSALIDRSTQRGGLHTCPAGMVMRGVSDDRSELLCVSPQGEAGAEVIQREQGNTGIQTCAGVPGAAYFLTGIDSSLAALACSPVTDPTTGQ